MQSLLDFLKRYNYWFVFAICEVISLVLLFQFNNYQGSVWFTSANEVVGKVNEWESGIYAYFNLKETNRELTDKNLVLEQRVNALSCLLERAEHKETEGETRQREQLKLFHRIDAQVVDNTIRFKDNYITINKGTDDGVRTEMGVVSGTGVVGIVYLTSHHYSLVIPMLNTKSSISCSLRGTGYFGNLSWDGVDPLYVTLNDIPRHARFKKGDVVVTSGHSDVFPEGLFVGKVSKVSNSRDGLFYQLQVHLGIDFSRLREVSVVYSPQRTEIMNLQKQAEEADKRDNK